MLLTAVVARAIPTNATPTVTRAYWFARWVEPFFDVYPPEQPIPDDHLHVLLTLTATAAAALAASQGQAGTVQLRDLTARLAEQPQRVVEDLLAGRPENLKIQFSSPR